MNQGSRLRYDQLRESDPTSVTKFEESPEASEEAKGRLDAYGRPGHVRNLCFAWPDGKKLFLNYAYLVSCDYEANSEANLIRLGFTSHTVTLKGYRLEELYFAVMEQLPRIIEAEDARYADACKGKAVVTEILVATS